MRSNPNPFRRPVGQDEYEQWYREAQPADRSLVPVRPNQPPMRREPLPPIMTQAENETWANSATEVDEVCNAMEVVGAATNKIAELSPQDTETRGQILELRASFVEGKKEYLYKLGRGDFRRRH